MLRRETIAPPGPVIDHYELRTNYEQPVLIGTITKIISDKGIGFITPCGRGKDVFFHCSAVAGDLFEQLTEGQAVHFDLEPVQDTGERARAARVEPCDSKLLGRSGAAEAGAQHHPRARRRKPSWRK